MDTNVYTKKLFALLVLTILFTGLYFYNVHQIKIVQEKEDARLAEIANAKSLAYRDMNIIAKSALVFDITQNKSLYEFHATTKRPLASVTKIMTAIIAGETFDPLETITITPESLQTEGENNLVANEVWNINDLVKFMLVVSSNDAAVAIRNTTEHKQQKINNEYFFVTAMNEKAKEIGMTQTIFQNESGLDIENETVAGAIGNAFDVATMASFAYSHFPELFKTSAQSNAIFTSRSGYVHDVKNTNDSIPNIPEITLSKTGFTDLAGGNLVIIILLKGNPYVIVVLGSTETGRFSDIETLYERTKKLVESGILN